MSRNVTIPIAGRTTGTSATADLLTQTIEIERLTIDDSDGEKIVDEIHRQINDYECEFGYRPEILYLDGTSYLKMKHFLLDNHYHYYANPCNNNYAKFRDLDIQIIPFRKCIKVGHSDIEKEATRLAHKYSKEDEERRDRRSNSVSSGTVTYEPRHWVNDVSTAPESGTYSITIGTAALAELAATGSLPLNDRYAIFSRPDKDDDDVLDWF